MPRFHFNVFDGVTELDKEGTQLAGVTEARQQAMRLASELIKSEMNAPRLGEDWRIEVTDGRGMILFRRDLTLSRSPAAAKW